MTATATDSTVIYTADVAKAARDFARQKGLDVGTRGRISAALFTQYFLARPKAAREVAKAYGMTDVPVRGRINKAVAKELATLVR